MASRLDWNGPAAQAHVHERALVGINRTVAAIADKARELVSTPGPSHSLPGQPPHMQSGELKAGINSEVDERSMTWRVGTTAPQGLWMETGTRRGIAPRPWLRPAMAQVLADMGRYLGDGK